MQALVWRYISLKHKESDLSPITEDHIQEVKSDISSLKFQLWGVLKNNGMKIPSEEKKDRSKYLCININNNVLKKFYKEKISHLRYILVK